MLYHLTVVFRPLLNLNNLACHLSNRLLKISESVDIMHEMSFGFLFTFICMIKIYCYSKDTPIYN